MKNFHKYIYVYFYKCEPSTVQYSTIQYSSDAWCCSIHRLDYNERYTLMTKSNLIEMYMLSRVSSLLLKYPCKILCFAFDQSNIFFRRDASELSFLSFNFVEKANENPSRHAQQFSVREKFERLKNFHLFALWLSISRLFQSLGFSTCESSSFLFSFLTFSLLSSHTHTYIYTHTPFWLVVLILI